MDLFDAETDNFLSQIELPVPEFDEEFNLTLSQIDVQSIIDDIKVNVGELGASGQTSKRFQECVTVDQVEEAKAASTPTNTRKSTLWGVNAWDSWGKWRNDKTLSDGVKESLPYTLAPPLTAELTHHEFNYWMCRFILEVRRQDGKSYPAESLRLICTSIWRYLRDSCRRYDLNFFDRAKPEFADIRECLDSTMKKLDRETPHTKKQAEPVSRDEETVLWEKVFSRNDAEALQFAVYFYACKAFGLRAADEHSNLEVEQFTFGQDNAGKFVRFVGRKSKTTQGGIFHKNADNKDIKQYAAEQNERCIVGLFRRYMDLIPESGPFYRRPLASRASDRNPRYSPQKVGVHTIQKLMPRMCAAAGIDGYKTGHSGKVTTATTLYQEGVDEQLIAARTGHRSNAIRAYKRTSNDQNKAISDSLQPPPPKTITQTATATATSSSSGEINIEKDGFKLQIKF